MCFSDSGPLLIEQISMFPTVLRLGSSLGTKFPVISVSSVSGTTCMGVTFQLVNGIIHEMVRLSLNKCVDEIRYTTKENVLRGYLDIRLVVNSGLFVQNTGIYMTISEDFR